MAARRPKITREEWLLGAVKKLAPLFRKHGHKLPAIRVSCGFTGAGRKSIGVCYYPDGSKDKTTEIFISPTKADSMRVVDILAHELCHAVLGYGKKHGPEFQALAGAIGLQKPWTATTATDAFKRDVAKPIVKELGKYPHAELNGITEQKKQSTRMHKAVCKKCGYTVRISKKWVDEKGAPHCPADGAMNVEVKDAA